MYIQVHNTVECHVTNGTNERTDGGLSLDDTFSVSKKAWKMGGSKMFVLVGKQVRVEDLIRGIIVHSGNDASIVVAEGIGGSEISRSNGCVQIDGFLLFL